MHPTAGQQIMAPSYTYATWCGFLNDETVQVQFSDNCGSPFTFTFTYGEAYNPSVCGTLGQTRIQGCTGCCSGPLSIYAQQCDVVDTALCDTTACLDNTACIAFDQLLFQYSCTMTTIIIGVDTLTAIVGPQWEFVDAYNNCIAC